MPRTVRVPVRFNSVKPSPERVQQRAERVAEERGGRVVSWSVLEVGRNRHRSTVWDATVTIEIADEEA